MAKLNINFKPSVWQHRIWQPLFLSPEFNKIHYNYTLTNKKLNKDLKGRVFEITWNGYQNLKNKYDIDLPDWQISKDCLLKFKVNNYSNKQICESEFIGWDKYIFYKRSSSNKKNFICFTNLESTDLKKYRLKVRLFYDNKISRTDKTKIRNIITNYMENLEYNNSELILKLFEKKLKRQLEIEIYQTYTLKRIEFQKLKLIK
jgi:ribosomal protein S3AE